MIGAPMKQQTVIPMSLVYAVFVWVLMALTVGARGEYTPRPTMADLMGSDFVAVGRFALQEGKIDFVLERMIKGDADAALLRMRDVLNERKNLVTVAPQGGLSYQQYFTSRFETYRATDATKTAVWFLMPSRGGSGIERRAIELAEGFAALLGGKEPGLKFRALQTIDIDMRREALESLHAAPDAAVVSQLHELALRADTEVGHSVFAVLSQTQLLEVDRFWGRWTGLPHAHSAGDILAKRDKARMIEELRQAIVAETDPTRLESLLYMIPNASPERVELSLPYLNHASESVRSRVIGALWNAMWGLNASASSSVEAKDKLAALGRRFIPLLEERLKVETDPSCKASLTKMLARENGVPWILRVPKEEVDPEAPAYSEEEELKFLVNCLTSSTNQGFIMESAGREIAERFFAEGFERLKAAGAKDAVYDTGMVFDGMGYVRHPQMFEYLVEHLTRIGPGGETFGSTLRALGVQDAPGSLAAIQRFSKRFDPRKFDGLAVLSDKGTLAYLKELEVGVKKDNVHRSEVPYLRARAMHGDPWAVGELLAALEEPPAAQFLTEYSWSREDVIKALCAVDTPEATEVLKRAVEDSWPSQSTEFPHAFTWAGLENYAGSYIRNTPLGEVARRDPQWLADLALRKMADASLPARTFAADIFHQLTGRLGDYRAEAFRRERIEPLKKLEAWWSGHKTASREQWLTSLFKEKGFAIEALDKKALPELVRALEADRFIHQLAVEQISVICRKYFSDLKHQHIHKGQERMNARVIGWLRARDYLPGL